MTFREPAEVAEPTGDVVPTGARKLRINQSDLDTYGYTGRCPQCEHAKKHGKSAQVAVIAMLAARGSSTASATLKMSAGD